MLVLRTSRGVHHVFVFDRYTAESSKAITVGSSVRVLSPSDEPGVRLFGYRIRHRSFTFAEYAVGNVTRHLGELMAVDVTDKTVKNYQTARLKERAAPKTINEEVGFLLRLLGEAGEPIRVRLRRQKALKLAIREQVTFDEDPTQSSLLTPSHSRITRQQEVGWFCWPTCGCVNTAHGSFTDRVSPVAASFGKLLHKSHRIVHPAKLTLANAKPIAPRR